MSQFIQSLRRLYENQKIDDKKLKELLDTKKINQQEYTYIISAKRVV